jgi:mono/diheme cytochrome c family protein
MNELLKNLKPLKPFAIALGIIVVLTVVIAGLRGTQFRRFEKPPIEVFPDMDRQPRFKSQDPSQFFADGRADRPEIKGTVPFGKPTPDSYKVSGMINGNWGDGIPVDITPTLMARGQERYTIHCAVCHGATGAGNGMTSKYGLVGIANLLQPNFVSMSDGNIFYTITHGKGQMGGYGHISLEDRWAIVAYVRALQRARNATVNDLPEPMRAELK